MKRSKQIFLTWISVATICICMGGFQPITEETAMVEEPIAERGYQSFTALPDNMKIQLETNEAPLEQQQSDMIVPSDDPFTITIEHADGSRTLEVFSDPIRYTDDNGNTQFIDTAMETTDWKTSLFEGYAYKNASNDIEVQYAKTVDKGLEVDDTFTLLPYPDENRVPKAAKKAVMDTTDNGNGRLTYPEAFGEDTYVEYINTTKGFKENIILTQYTGQTRFDFRWASDTHTLVLADDGSIQVVQRDDPTAIDYRFMPLYVYDSYTGEEAASPQADEEEPPHRHFSMDATYELTAQEDGSFIITSVIPEEYLIHPETVYPVTIDPSLTVANTNSNIQDSYVMEKSPTTNFGSLNFMSFGYSGNSGKMYGYVKHKTLPALPANTYVTSAYLKLTFQTGQTTPVSMKGSVQRCSAAWTETGITWNNKPATAGTTVQVLPTMNGSFLDYYNFDVASIVNGWYSGRYAQNGLMFTYQTPTYNDYNSVVSSEGDSRMPKLTINTSVSTGQTEGIVNGGIYFLKSRYSGLYIASPNTGYDNLFQTAKDSGWFKARQWKVVYLSNGLYEFHPMHNTDLLMSDDTSRDTDGNKIFSCESTGGAGQKFRIISNGNGTYRIMPSCSKTRVLDAYGPSTTDGTPIVLWTYINGSHQQWYFETGTTLNTPQIGQEKDQWCWAASALMAAKTYGATNKTQSDIVKYTVGSTLNVGVDFAEVVGAANYACNFQAIHCLNGVLTQDELILELNYGNPVIISRGWYPNNDQREGGHDTVIYGYYASNNTYQFMIRDPLPVNTGRSYSRTYAEILDGRSTNVDTGRWERSILKTG